MRPIPVDTPAFFNRGPSPLARLAFFGVLSLALLFADTRYRYLENVRQVVAIALHPVERALGMPGAAFAYVYEYFASKRLLADDNALLRQELVARAPATSVPPCVPSLQSAPRFGARTGSVPACEGLMHAKS